jgi:hypothetical protein
VLLTQLEWRVGLFDTHTMPALVALGRRHGDAAAPELARRVAAAASPPVPMRAA